MKSTGVIRRVDDLGRIVIPREIRKQLKIEDKPLEFLVSGNGQLILKPYGKEDYTLRKSCDWEELYDPRGNVIAQGSKLSAEEILSALDIKFHTEEFEKN